MAPTFAFVSVTVFIMFYMSGPCVGYGPEPFNCNPENERNYTQISRTIFSTQYEIKTGRWKLYHCGLERKAREYFESSETEVPNPDLGQRAPCPRFAHELEKPQEEDAQMNVFRLAKYAFGNWTDTDEKKKKVEEASLIGCHYHRTNTTGKVVCVFCK
ncbi:hypothetical protein Y032_0126g1355 [Ancylostoma ceylanicum]|nr:hypothetical protein Y032_0126g1355 [Ancylostoma ceylanicum]